MVCGYREASLGESLAELMEEVLLRLFLPATWGPFAVASNDVRTVCVVHEPGKRLE